MMVAKDITGFARHVFEVDISNFLGSGMEYEKWRLTRIGVLEAHKIVLEQTPWAFEDQRSAEEIERDIKSRFEKGHIKTISLSPWQIKLSEFLLDNFLRLEGWSKEERERVALDGLSDPEVSGAIPFAT